MLSNLIQKSFSIGESITDSGKLFHNLITDGKMKSRLLYKAVCSILLLRSIFRNELASRNVYKTIKYLEHLYRFTFLSSLLLGR